MLSLCHWREDILPQVLAVLQGFGLIAFVVAVGWLLAHTGLLREGEERVLATVTFWAGAPALLFLLVARSDVHVVFSGYLAATLAGALVSGAVVVAVFRLLLRRSATHALVSGMSASYVNAGNLGLPIAVYVLGDGSLAAPIVLLQLLLLQPAWLAALDAVGGDRTSLRRLATQPLRNPLTVASLLGLGAALTGLVLPTAVVDPLELLGGLAIPAMLLAFGASLRGAPLPGSGGGWPELAAVLGAKLVLMPVVTGLTALALGLDRSLVAAATVLAALPTAQNVFILAVTYGRGVRVAREAVFVTTVCALPAMLVTVGVLG